MVEHKNIDLFGQIRHYFNSRLHKHQPSNQAHQFHVVALQIFLLEQRLQDILINLSSLFALFLVNEAQEGGCWLFVGGLTEGDVHVYPLEVEQGLHVGVVVTELAEFLVEFVEEVVGRQPVGFNAGVLLDHKGHIVELAAIVDELTHYVLDAE